MCYLSLSRGIYESRNQREWLSILILVRKEFTLDPRIFAVDP